MRPTILATMCVLCFAVAACSQGQPPGGGWTFDGGVTDAGRDASQDTGSDTRQDSSTDVDPSPDPVETTIWLENDTDKTLYVQEASNCRISPPSWIDWRSRGRIVDYCAICNCAQIERGEGCGACPEACAIDQVQPVEPGSRVEWEWSGYLWQDDQVDQQQCERRTVPSPGEQMRVSVCWGDSYSGSGDPGEWTGTVDDPECEEVRFLYGSDEAGHTVEAEVTNPGPPTFKLTNDREDPVRLLTLSDCGTDLREWISVRRSGERIKLRSSCAECQCGSISDNGQCIVCGKACDRREVQTLAAGETRTYGWDGVGWRTSQRNGRQCVERIEASSGDALEAVFCWTYQTDGDFGFEDRFCDDVSFTYGPDREVSYAIE